MRFGAYLLRRTALSLVAVAGAITLIFIITHALPGNPILARVTLASPDILKQINHQLGLDRPLADQFGSYLLGLADRDLGQSWVTGRPVAQDLLSRLPASLELAVYATLLSVLVGVPLGILAAVRRRGVADRVVRAIASLGLAMPVFWVGLLLIFFLYYLIPLAGAPLGRIDVNVTPVPVVTGFLTIDSLLAGSFDSFANAVSHLFLPVVTLAFAVMPPLVRMTRATMLDNLAQSYVRAGRALGLTERTVVLHDALQNSLIAILTTGGLVFGYLISGSVLVEHVFAWPGIGQYAFNALVNNDFAAIQGFVLVVAISYVTINWIVEALYGAIDPRIRA